MGVIPHALIEKVQNYLEDPFLPEYDIIFRSFLNKNSELKSPRKSRNKSLIE
jgi:hypothetical protein